MKHPIKNTPSFYHSLDLYKDNGDIFISEGSGGNRVITFPTKDFIPETCQDLSQEPSRFIVLNSGRDGSGLKSWPLLLEHRHCFPLVNIAKTIKA